MSLGNAVTQLARTIGDQLFPHHRDDTNPKWNLLQQERRKERIQIACELHDTLLQGFLSASMQLCLVDDRLPLDSPAKPMLRRALDLVRRAINEGRAALLGLRSPALPDGSLEKALHDVQDDFPPSERTRLRFVIIGDTKPLEPAVHEQIFWIAREALLNALQHSEASGVEVKIEYLRRKLRVVVWDNGIGINPQVLQSGKSLHWGLTGMRERAASIGAEVRVWSKQGKGTEVRISMPMRERGPA